MVKSSLENRLRSDLPDVNFLSGEVFYWNPCLREIGYCSDGSDWLLLHEVAHYLLHHEAYVYDMELLDMEVAAWKLVFAELAAKYGVSDGFSDVDHVALARDRLKSYEEWLVARSTCPKCGATCFQGKDLGYFCRHCEASWRPNDSRFKRIWRKNVESANYFDAEMVKKLLQ
jgi:hypothetical protein